MGRDEPKTDSRRTEVHDNKAAPADATHCKRIAELYRQQEKALLRMLVARVRSQHEARDIAHEAYTKVLAHDRPDTVRSLERFLWATAENIATDHARKHKYREGQTEALAYESDASSPSPEALFTARERLGICCQAMEQLPPKCRMAFVLRIFDELSITEIAQRMSIDVSGVAKHLTRGYEHCRRAVDDAEQAKRSAK